ncbi:MAG: ionic transporter y4hA [Bacteroidia bacterium]|jgi:Ca2+:H+ antiporter|nr:ionic transporter y4hA [Bacteroidia bacterium]
MKSTVQSLVYPLFVVLVAAMGITTDIPYFYILGAVALIAGVMQAVHHAEAIAHKIGEPYGALVLAVAVTVIEVSIIVSLMLEGGDNTSGLARDTVFAAVMIILNGMVGLVLLIGGLKFHEQYFSMQGVKSALTVLFTISVFIFILPNYTQATPGPYYNHEQLLFVAIVTLLLYMAFLFVQNIRHRNDFIPPQATNQQQAQGTIAMGQVHTQSVLQSWILLPILLIAVVLLAEHLAPDLDYVVTITGAPKAISGIVIASIILLPEAITAVKAALRNELQTSLNLSLGSALATIGLSIPTVACVSYILDIPLSLGISDEATVLFILSLLVNVMSLSTGRTSILHGIVLLVLFSVYLLTVWIP